jgi:hypothetical protein
MRKPGLAGCLLALEEVVGSCCFLRLKYAKWLICFEYPNGLGYRGVICTEHTEQSTVALNRYNGHAKEFESDR